MKCVRKLNQINARRFYCLLFGLSALFLCLYGITNISPDGTWSRVSTKLRMTPNRRIHDVRNTTILPRNSSAFRNVNYSAEAKPFTSLHHRLSEAEDEHIHHVPTIPDIRPLRRVHDVSCSAILSGNANEIKKANCLMRAKNFTRLPHRLSDTDYIQQTKDCDTFRQSRGYFMRYFSEQERDFSIAYSILLYKEVEQAERLLRAIYHPNNHYCIHVDADAHTDVHDAIDGIAKCLHNVFVVKKEYVIYAGFTRLQADLNCMEALLKMDRWKYFINLPSQNFPIKTNSEIVQILKLYNGTSDIGGTITRTYANRHSYIYTYINKGFREKASIKRTAMRKDNPPFKMTVVKGSAYGAFSRAFVKFVCGSRVARVLLDWMRDIYSPDEYYWATLQYNPHVGTPGGYAGMPEDKPHLSVYVSWAVPGASCAGKFVRFVCVFGVGDLSSLIQKPTLFVNKFHLEYQAYALDCIEEWHLNRTATGIGTFDMTYYENLFVKK